MEDSAHAAQEVLAKRTLREYTPQIIISAVLCPCNADASSSAIASHPGKG